jgi:hypothetical protein
MPGTHPFIKKQLELGIFQPVKKEGQALASQASTSALSAAFAAKARELETNSSDPDMSRVLGALPQVFQ